MATARHALRQRREHLDLSQEEVALKVGVSTTTYRAWEAGTQSPRVGRRRPLAVVLDWPPARLNLALDGEVATPNGQAAPEWLKLHVQLEQSAARIRAFHPFTIHALLQIDAYAEAVERADATPRTDEGVIRRVELRLARQGVLHREPDPVQFSVVLDESTLLRVTGSAAVMGDQLVHLDKLAALPNVDLRFLPLVAGRHSAAFGSFTLIGDPPQIVCVEDRTGIRYLESEHAVDAHLTVFDHLSKHALTADDSVDLIRTVANERYHR